MRFPFFDCFWNKASLFDFFKYEETKLEDARIIAFYSKLGFPVFHALNDDVYCITFIINFLFSLPQAFSFESN